MSEERAEDREQELRGLRAEVESYVRAFMEGPEGAELLHLVETHFGAGGLRDFLAAKRRRAADRWLLCTFLIDLFNPRLGFRMRPGKVRSMVEAEYERRSLPHRSTTELLVYYTVIIDLPEASPAFEQWLHDHGLWEYFSKVLKDVKLNKLVVAAHGDLSWLPGQDERDTEYEDQEKYNAAIAAAGDDGQRAALPSGEAESEMIRPAQPEGAGREQAVCGAEETYEAEDGEAAGTTPEEDEEEGE